MDIKTYLTEYLRYCLKNNIMVEPEGHYQTKIKFDSEPFYISDDGSDIELNYFKVGVKKEKVVKKGKKVVSKVSFQKDKLPVIGRALNVQPFLFKYSYFLISDGITNPDMMMYYILHLMVNKCEFMRKNKRITHGDKNEVIKVYDKWVQYSPEFSDVEKMIKRVIIGSLKTDRSKVYCSKKRVKCVINPITLTSLGGTRKLTKNERLRTARKGSGKATENRIKSLYDESKTIKENAEIIGLSEITIKRYRKNNVESKEDKIKRMYNPDISLKENSRIIGVSLNTLKKYLPDKKEVSDIEDNWIDDMLIETSNSWELDDKKNDKKEDKNKPVISDTEDWLDKIDFDDF